MSKAIASMWGIRRVREPLADVRVLLYSVLLTAAEFMSANEIRTLRCTGSRSLDGNYCEAMARKAVHRRPRIEQDRSPRDSNQSWLRILSEIDRRMLRRLVFTTVPTGSGLEIEPERDTVVGSSQLYNENGSILGPKNSFNYPVASCEPVGETGCPTMRAGVHYAEIKVRNIRLYFTFGLVRPGAAGGGMHVSINSGWNYAKQPNGCRTNRWPSRHPGFKNAGKRNCFWSFLASGDTVGLLLDFSRGSVSLLKNREWVGMIVPMGIEGELSWAVGMVCHGDRLQVYKVDTPWTIIDKAKYEQHIAAEWTPLMLEAWPHLCSFEHDYYDWVLQQGYNPIFAMLQVNVMADFIGFYRRSDFLFRLFPAKLRL